MNLAAERNEGAIKRWDALGTQVNTLPHLFKGISNLLTISPSLKNQYKRVLTFAELALYAAFLIWS
jgi:hypothetical protein